MLPMLLVAQGSITGTFPAIATIFASVWWCRRLWRDGDDGVQRRLAGRTRDTSKIRHGYRRPAGWPTCTPD